MVVVTSHCSSCSSQTDPDDSYCQDCGLFLAHCAEPTPATNFIDPHSGEYLANLSPRSAKPVIALPVVAAVVALFLMVPWGIYALERSYSSISAQYICEQANKNIDEQRPGVAIELLGRLSLAHGGLTASQQQQMNRALFQEADQCILAGKYQSALADLKRISKEFARQQELQERAEVCKRYLWQQANIAKSSRGNSILHGARPQYSQNSLASLESKLAAAERQSRHKAEHKDAAGTRKLAPVSAPVKFAESKEKVRKIASYNSSNIAVDATTTSNSDALQSRVPETAAADKPKAKSSAGFAHNDVVRYNELLAGYFSSRSGVQSGDLHEPPSFREWIEMGKTKF